MIAHRLNTAAAMTTDDTDAQWLLFGTALTAQPRLTAAIETAVVEALRGEKATPAEICLALAHVLAARCSEDEDPQALLAATFQMARLFTRAAGPANDRR